MVQAIREVHHAHGFVEVETPTLIKSHAEGARDFIVPSRLQPGSVYALPQSPQQLKQLLMVAGIDRYFQIARCYRDEDLRGDRQPEFTQLDLEMSFVDEDAVMGFVEAMVIEVSRATVPDRPIREVPFPRFTYEEAMERFGSDKPDVRFGMELVDLAPVLVEPTASPHRASASSTTRWPPAAGSRRSSRPGMAGATRREIDELTERREAVRREGPRPPGARGGRRGQGPDRQVPRDDDAARRHRRRPATPRRPDPDRRRHAPTVTADVLGRLRAELGERLGLADPNVLAYVWVHRFPMYQWDAENAAAGTPPTTRSAASCPRTRRSW